ncbi:hypothetical protein EGR_10408 [Echinococcus granulosus]|uniref:Uncharacterized protein n=1 Tax=Echinococcus granulosus TaxID=6210 RepID=W6U8F6_ECHGR|nr:hypothetical protein EGR_10408 [Echinococcus granulosus]EUB54727.1 hypothetical protein EGR_10408 [Echinococcus granulosus]
MKESKELKRDQIIISSLETYKDNFKNSLTSLKYPSYDKLVFSKSNLDHRGRNSFLCRSSSIETGKRLLTSETYY